MSRVVSTILVIAASMAAVAAVSSFADASETVNYSYDAKGRLVEVEHSGSINDNVVTNYSFDKADNRINVKVTGAP